MARARWIRWLAWSGAGVLTLLAVLVGGAYMIVGTAAGRAWGLTKLLPALAESGGYALALDGVDATRLEHWTIAAITVRREGAKVLEAKQVRLSWTPAALWERRVEITGFQADTVNVPLPELSEKLTFRGPVSATLTLSGLVSDIHIKGEAQATTFYRDLPLRLRVQGQGTPEAWTLHALDIATGETGTLALSGTYDRGALDFSAAAKAIPGSLMAAAGWELQPGTLNADLTLTGTQQRPALNGTAHFRTEVAPSGRVRRQTIPLNVAMEIATEEEQVQLQADVLRRQQHMGRATLTTPLAPWFAPDNPMPLQGTLILDTDLSWLRLLLTSPTHIVRGTLTAELSLAGTLAAPAVTGRAMLREGHYENLLTGTVLEDIRATVVAGHSRLSFSSASASDGRDGRLSLSGLVDWSEEVSPPVEFTATAHDAQLLRRHDMEGVLDGTLELAGNFREVTLTGVLDVMPLIITLDTFLTEEIPELEVKERQSAAAMMETSPAEEVVAPTINLDVTLRAERQAFLRGRGLEAELEGRVEVGGTLQEPEYSGSFQTLRGRYEILGKAFVLKEGRLRFEGERVVLFIPGVYEGENATIRAELSGTPDNLELALSSVPAMPQEEILSQLLFDRSTQSITPLQAVRLANAVNTLRDGGGEGLFDPAALARNLLGLDALTFGTDEGTEGEGVNVGIGKYLGERVYLEVETGSDPATPVKGSVEIELTPSLNLESSTGGAGVGVELQWRRDY